MAFSLHPRLAADTVDLGAFELCRLLMMDDAHYPWFILVPQRPGLTEIHQLAGDELAMFWGESAALSAALERAFDADKLNVAALGNVVPQLHLHHVVRYRDDPAWPAPVWGRLPPKAMDDGLRRERLAALRAQSLPGLSWLSG